MPSTFLSLHYHVVFSTKLRERLIDTSWRSRLHDYLGGTVNGLGGRIEKVGGLDDHVHLLFQVKATHTLSIFMRDLKRDSSLWVHAERRQPEFAWQEGYAAFTVSASAAPDVVKYIRDQEEHHRQRSFREELKLLLKKSGVPFEERYLD